MSNSKKTERGEKLPYGPTKYVVSNDVVSVSGDNLSFGPTKFVRDKKVVEEFCETMKFSKAAFYKRHEGRIGWGLNEMRRFCEYFSLKILIDDHGIVMAPKDASDVAGTHPHIVAEFKSKIEDQESEILRLFRENAELRKALEK